MLSDGNLSLSRERGKLRPRVDEREPFCKRLSFHERLCVSLSKRECKPKCEPKYKRILLSQRVADR
jgi:hypothetical protein